MHTTTMYILGKVWLQEETPVAAVNSQLIKIELKIVDHETQIQNDSGYKEKLSIYIIHV